MNEQIEMTRQALASVINNSGLPIGVVNLIVRDISNQLESVYQQTVMKEHAAQAEQAEKPEEEAGE